MTEMTDQELINKFEDLDDAVNNLKEQVLRQEGQKEQLEKSLNELGFKTVSEASKNVEQLRKKHKTISDSIAKMFVDAENILEKIRNNKKEF